ncbi:hypothetical protein M877_31495 [Streptomyces niveus NCIMB 11891]|nr:hypothetical protein M877_31495 [Streptomyces niveus NCIMB 11891]
MTISNPSPNPSVNTGATSRYTRSNGTNQYEWCSLLRSVNGNVSRCR